MDDIERKIIRRVKSSTLPSQVFLFDVIYALHQTNYNSKSFDPHPISIRYTRWRTRNQRRVTIKSGWMQPDETFWDEVKKLASPGTCSLFMSCSAYVDWTKLGLWDKVLSGEIINPTPDVQRPEDEKKAGGKRWRPLWITEDPPTILTFRFAEKSGTIIAIDPRNYAGSFRPSFDVSGEPYTEDGATDFTEPQREQNRSIARVARMERFYNDHSTTLIEYDLGSMRWTFASQAEQIWRHSFIPKNMETHRHADTLELERAAYYGGRCECKRLGKVNEAVFQFDFNACYPYCAANFEVPIRLAFERDAADLTTLVACENGIHAIADVDIETEVPGFPLRLDDKVIYPVGRFRTTLAGPELSIAVNTGVISRVHSASVYDLGSPLLDFYTFWNELRCGIHKESHPDFYSFWKQLGNGLIGRLAQKHKKWTVLPNRIGEYPFECFWGHNPVTNQLTIFRTFAGVVSYLDDDGEAERSLPAIAAFVNSYARVLLWNAMSTAGHENVFYYDTDSIWVNRDGCERLFASELCDQTEWGKLKLVGGYSHVEFTGIKHYTADAVVKCAGMPKLRVALGTFDRDRYEVRKVMSDLWAKKSPFAEIVESKLGRAGPYRHGKVQQDGSIKPWRIEEW